MEGLYTLSSIFGKAIGALQVEIIANHENINNLNVVDGLLKDWNNVIQDIEGRIKNDKCKSR